MSDPLAQSSFKKGLAALAEGRDGEAARYFLDAMQAEWRRKTRRHDMRFLSYYGFSLARAGISLPQAVQACEQAVARDPQNPVLLLNLGRVYLMTGRRGRALHCFERGLAAAPHHRPLRLERDRCDRRRPPLFRSLSRSNPINRCAGRLRARLAPPAETPRRQPMMQDTR